MIRLMKGDCLEKMKDIPDKSVDMVLCDLPYGTTQNKWDSVIPLGLLWEQYLRVCTDMVVLTAIQPFTSMLVMSNLKNFKYTWTWQKSLKTNFLNAKRQPLRNTEEIVVFSLGNCLYNPQGLIGGNIPGGGNKVTGSYGKFGGEYKRELMQENTNYPCSLLSIPNPNQGNVHPTQKPVALMLYLIKTYTNEGMTVLDNCMGSGTTGVAARQLCRNFIGIEKDPDYYQIAVERIKGAKKNDPPKAT